jgi:UMF1 family MFS transporter
VSARAHADRVIEPAAIPGAAAVELSSTGERLADTRGQISWALFEFARSPYVSLVFIFVFAPYFANVVVGDPILGQEYWGFANTLAGIVIALVAPFLGAISDCMGRRKTWIAAILGVMAPACMLLWFAMPKGQGGLPVGLILAIAPLLLACFVFSEVFHNAMLPSIARSDRVGTLSGYGLAAGNSGTLTALLLMLFLIALPASGLVDWSFLPERPLFGLDPAQHEHDRIAGPIAGVWLVVFSIPLFLFTPDRASTGVPLRAAAATGVGQVWLTIRQARRISNVGLYLLARMLYNDGKVAILAYCGIYAAGTFAWSLVEMLIFAIVLTPFSISGGLLGGWLDAQIGSKRAIQLCIGTTCLGILFAVSSTPDRLFFVLPYDAVIAGPVWNSPYFDTLPELIYVATFMLLAATITAAFANSRTLMARIAPVSMMSQFFGLYALSGSATAFLGHGVVTFFTRAFHSQGVGFASVALLLGAGFVLMHWVREERAPELVS